MQPATVPTIDISQPDSAAVATQLGRAFETTGFACIVGAGDQITSASDELTLIAREFFALPDKEKKKIHIDEEHMKHPDGMPGYLEPGHISVASLLGDHTRPPDAVEVIYFKDLHYYESDCPLLDAKPPKLAPKWPSKRFREATVAYFEQCFSLWERLVGLAEEALSLPRGFFAPFFGRAMSTSLQVRHYLDMGELEEGQLSFGAHTDSGILTILSTQQPGLQVDAAMTGDWVDIPALPGGFIVNVGRTLARWTNDRWLAAIHRVIPPPLPLSGGPTKLSIGFFSGPHPNATVECLPSCSGPDELPRYAPFNFGEFMTARVKLHTTGATADDDVSAAATFDPRQPPAKEN